MFSMGYLIALTIMVGLGTASADTDSDYDPVSTNMWEEIQRLRSLVNQETDLRLAFEQIFVTHLDHLRNIKSSIINETMSALQPALSSINSLERNVSLLENQTRTFVDGVNNEFKTIQQNISGLRRLGCLTGSQKYYSRVHSAWSQQRNITFSTAFDRIPAVSVGIRTLDSHKDYNIRANTEARNITETGFILILNTWSNTFQYGLKANWMACPAKMTED